MKFIAVNGNQAKIAPLSTKDDLDRTLASDMKSGSISGAHWFRIADLWYRVNCGYNNPLNLGHVHSELMLLNEEKESLRQLLKNRKLVFLGVGVGDTEMALVDMQLESMLFTELVLIDINPLFLKMFIYSLAAKKAENQNYDIRYLALRTFFEKVTYDNLGMDNSNYPRNAIICLGSTIGNFVDLRTIFGIFQKLTRQNDLIIIGYQLRKHLQVLYEKYKYNHLYRDLVGNFLPRRQKTQIEWKLNTDDSAIEAWLGEIQIFRSKKFDCQSVRAIANEYNWKELLCSVDLYENLCIHTFMKQ